MPDPVAEDQLTENQQRARDVAAGRALDASTLRRVLSAQSGEGHVHGKTVRRVRGFLQRLGGEQVEVTETRGGTTTVVFDEGLVRRIRLQAEPHGVVSGDGVGAGV